MVLGLTTAKFKPLMLSMHGFSFGWSVKLLLAVINRVIHGFTKVEVKIMLQLMVSRPVFLGVKHPSVAEDQIFITVRQ
jgi:hypothetical protein